MTTETKNGMDLGSAALGAAAMLAGAGARELFNWWRKDATDDASNAGFRALIEQRLSAIESSQRERFEAIKSTQGSMHEDFKSAGAEMRNAAVQIAALGQTQAVVNQVVAKAMESMISRQERETAKFNDLSQVVALMRSCGGHCGDIAKQ